MVSFLLPPLAKGFWPEKIDHIDSFVEVGDVAPLFPLTIIARVLVL